MEPDNREDHDAVAVMSGADVVGHVPRRISYICNIFLHHSGSIICHVTVFKRPRKGRNEGAM